MAPCSVVHAHPSSTPIHRCQGSLPGLYGIVQRHRDQIKPWPRIASSLFGRSTLDPVVDLLSSEEDHASHGIDPRKAENHNHKISAGAIAGITLGCLLVLVLFGLGVYYWRTRRARRVNSIDQDTVTEMCNSNSNSNYSGPSPPPRAMFLGKATTTSTAAVKKVNNSRVWAAQPMVTFSICSDDPNYDPAESGVISRGQGVSSSSSSSSLSRDRLASSIASHHSLDPHTGRLVTSYNPTSAESYRMDMGLQPSSSPNRSAAVYHHLGGSSGRITPEGAR